MKIFLIGLTGGVGTFFAQRALDAGHSIIALVRDPKRVSVKENSLLSLVTGDITLMGPEALATAMRGADVVVTAFGMSRTGGAVSPHAQEDGVRNILAAMSAAGVSRLVYCGGCFVKQPGDQWGWGDSALYTVLTNTVLRAVSIDAVKAFTLLEAAPSNITYYYLRFPALGDGPAAITSGEALGRMRIGSVNAGAGSPAVTLSRADAAHMLFDVATSPERVEAWQRKAPCVTL